jgi:RsiW-degrading membrane proteinase PrsW (M82 family)
MDLTFIFVIGFAPGVFWLWYFYHRDKLEPEPQHLVLRTFFLGLFVAIPAAIAEFVLSFVLIFFLFWVEKLFLAQVAAFMTLVIIAPVVEEYFKYLAARTSVYRHADFDEPMDGIVYAAAAALGFASIENVLYLFVAKQEAGWLGVEIVFIARALLSVPGHVLFSSIWGAALGRAKFIQDQAVTRRLILGSLLGAMALHGFFNFLAGLSIAAQENAAYAWVGAVGILALSVLAWIRIHRRMKEALKDSPHDPNNAALATAELPPSDSL